jgi:hypothetical protein
MDVIQTYLTDAQEAARDKRDNADTAAQGRCLSVVVTKIEEALLWLAASKGGLI